MKKVFKKNWQTWAEKHWIKTGCYEEIFQVELANMDWKAMN